MYIHLTFLRVSQDSIGKWQTVQFYSAEIRLSSRLHGTLLLRRLHSVTEAEVRTGIAILPEGERRRGLAAAAERLFSMLFSERILPFDSDAARTYAILAAERRAAGRPISQADCQIAAIARCRGMSVVTRNVNDFEESGFEVINP